MEKINSILTRKKCLKWLETPHKWVFGHANSDGTGLRPYIQMSPSYGLYICIILETAYHRTTFGIFCNITKNATPEENSWKMFHTSSPIVIFFLWEGSRMCWGIRIKFHLGRAKGRDKRVGMWGEAQKDGYFCKIPIIKQNTNFISQTVGQTNF